MAKDPMIKGMGLPAGAGGVAAEVVVEDEAARTEEGPGVKTAVATTRS
jgi:hypothetical protein